MPATGTKTSSRLKASSGSEMRAPSRGGRGGSGATCSSLPPRLPVGLELREHEADLLLGLVHERDAGRAAVAAAAVARRQLAHVGAAGAVEDAVAQDQHRVLAVGPPVQPQRDVGARVKGVDE